MRESVCEFFKDEIEAGLIRHEIDVHNLTASYLVFTLERFLSARGDLLTVPVFRQAEFAEVLVGERRAKRLKEVGDEALLISGIFRHQSQSLTYYSAFGATAYRKLSRMSYGRRLSFLFGELADKFLPLSHILAEIGERSRSTTDLGLIATFEEWRKTGRPYLYQLLTEHGFVLSQVSCKFRPC